MINERRPSRLAAWLVFLAALAPIAAWPHCDTLSGPVVRDARRALDSGDVTPVLKWVPAADEAQIRSAFARTRAVRGESAAARELADMYFFETLVRVHRAAEGAPYTGLKPAGSTDPGIELADQALESGDVNRVIQSISDSVRDGIVRRFQRVTQAGKHVDDSVEAGREYVEAYVDYVHFVENIHSIATSAGHFDHHNEVPAPSGN